MQDLFANGEVSFDMAYNPAEAGSLVENGRYPETTRTFVFDSGHHCQHPLRGHPLQL